VGKKRRGLVEHQRLSERPGNADSYERWVREHPGTEDCIESPMANPDGLPEQATRPSTPQLIMGEAVEHLQGRQREVYLSIMRDERSFAETAELLGIGKSTVQTHLDRAISFIKAYCDQAIKKERV